MSEELKMHMFWGTVLFGTVSSVVWAIAAVHMYSPAPVYTKEALVHECMQNNTADEMLCMEKLQSLYQVKTP